MAGLYLVNGMDVGRFLGTDPLRATVASVYERIDRLYLKEGGGRFNHDTSILSTFDIFRGAATTETAATYCLAHGSPAGHAQNASIIRAVGPYAEANVSRCERIGYAAIPVGRCKGRTLYVGLKAPFVRARAGCLFLVIPGYRKASRPVGREIDFLCSLAALQLARDDYEGAQVEYLMAGPIENSDERSLEVVHGDSLNLFSEADMNRMLEVYVEAAALHLEYGNGNRPARFAGYRVIDPDQRSFL